MPVGQQPISSAKPNAPFDIRTAIAPVVQMNRFTFVLYVNASLPIPVADLIAYGKANPGKLNYALGRRRLDAAPRDGEPEAADRA